MGQFVIEVDEVVDLDVAVELFEQSILAQLITGS